MFHTFETTQYASPEQAGQYASAAAKRRTSTTRACEACRKRKARCNGEHPCETCQWYRKAASCHYTEPRQRQMPTRRSVEKISQTLQEYRGILQKLYPNVHPDQLRGLPRDKLVELISKTSPFQPPSPQTPSTEGRPFPINPDAGSLEQLQPMPEERNDASVRKSAALRGITDDVNVLSLSVKQNPSYLGISSVMAILRVITWLDPDCLSKSPDRSVVPSRAASSPPEVQILQTETSRYDLPTSSAWVEIPLINAYFTHVHPFIPLIEEQCFRETYMAAQRTDSRWLLLLNTVLAMGSVASGTSEDAGHQIYFNRAKQFLTIDTLDSAHLETVQALAILSGFYLHYVQIPNQASALMGATLKIATMLGLHRDYSEGVGPAKAKVERAANSIEMRRRIWWCTFMLDTWAANTLGRPSMGRTSPAITAKSPQEPIGQSSTMLTLVQENIRFCIISTKMEDALAICPLLDEHDRHTLDAAHVEWFGNSSVQMQTPISANEPPGITTLKNVMRWRYCTNRIFLHRPVLLWYAMRKITWDKLSDERRTAIELCREACADLIHDITSTWRGYKPCQMSGWNAVWLIYQAVMVPLLSLYSDPWDKSVVGNSRRQVETAIATMRDLQCWSTTAKRSIEVVVRLYEASKRHYGAFQMSEVQDVFTDMTPASSDTFRPSYIDVTYANAYGVPQTLNTASQDVFMDDMFDTLRWSTSWDSPIGGSSMMNGWDYASMQNWAGMPQGETYDYFDVHGFEVDSGRLGFSDMDVASSVPAEDAANLIMGPYSRQSTS
ncbi:transcriptional regulatory protein GAL4 [Exophiala viscosa]|uniref:Transcriptional regulatory protein GAL4 n=1 Tax=Exophiala viscosa TaxID=2486360 RepID=A0AAN6E3N0_9EURO|nr:transcriptional regulatory protein GAL4 [Exophiala viscosa]